MRYKNADEFKKAVTSLASQEDEFLLNHSGKEEGSIVMGTMFKYSKKCIKMFVGDFNGAISDDEYYLKNLEDFINRGGRVKVLIQNIKTIPTKAYKLISRYEGLEKDGEKRVILERTNETVLYETKDGETREMHFTIGDDKIFRIEHDTQKYLGIASFNAPNVVNELDKKFEEILKKESRVE